jgi:hypothetical protein
LGNEPIGVFRNVSCSEGKMDSQTTFFKITPQFEFLMSNSDLLEAADVAELQYELEEDSSDELEDELEDELDDEHEEEHENELEEEHEDEVTDEYPEYSDGLNED